MDGSPLYFPLILYECCLHSNFSEAPNIIHAQIWLFTIKILLCLLQIYILFIWMKFFIDSGEAVFCSEMIKNFEYIPDLERHSYEFYAWYLSMISSMHIYDIITFILYFAYVIITWAVSLMWYSSLCVCHCVNKDLHATLVPWIQMKFYHFQIVYSEITSQFHNLCFGVTPVTKWTLKLIQK